MTVLSHQKEVSVAFCGCLYLYPLFACMYSPHKLYIYDKFIFVIIIVHVLFIHHFTKKKGLFTMKFTHKNVFLCNMASLVSGCLLLEEV